MKSHISRSNLSKQEVLSEILSLSLPYVHEIGNEVVIPWGRPALGTCYRWRVCVLHTPSVWGRLFITETTTIEGLETWLSRASQTPLHVTLNFQDHPTTGAHVRWLWNRIAAHPIQSFALHCDSDFDLRWIFPLRGKIAALREFTMEILSRDESEPAVIPQIFGPDPPLALTSLKIIDDSDSDNEPFLLEDFNHFDASTLMHLQLHAAFRNHWTFITQCSALKRFSADVYRLFGAGYVLKAPISASLAELERLDLIAEDLEPFLRRVHAPKLHQLGLDLDQGLSHLSDTFQFTSIRYLRLTNAWRVSEDLLPRFSELEHLALFDWSDQDVPVLRFLTEASPDATTGDYFVCPKLRELKCRTHSPHVSVYDFHPLVRTRVSVQNPLAIYLPSYERPQGKLYRDWMKHLKFEASSPSVQW